MFLPSKNQYVEFSEKAGLIPVFKEIVADLDTPLTLFAKIEEEYEHTFLFESMEGGEKCVITSYSIHYTKLYENASSFGARRYPSSAS